MEDVNKNNEYKKNVKTYPIQIVSGFEIFSEKALIKDEGVVVKYFKETEDKLDKYNLSYFLMEKIKDLEYYFSASEDIDKKGSFYFSFDTKYEFARTYLEKEQKDKLFSIINTFLETIYRDQKNNFKDMWMSLSETGYSKEEIDNCISEILKKEQDKNKNEILDMGIHKIFLLYKELYGKNFEYTNNSKKFYYRRMQIFEEQFKEKLLDWDMVKTGVEGEEKLILIRK